MRLRSTVLVVLLAPAAVARAQAPAAPPASAIAPAPPEPPAPTPASAARKGFDAVAGWGYYEAMHAGVAYHVTSRAAFGLFGGYGVAEAQTVTLGATFAHDLYHPIRTLQPGWNLKALFWTRSDDNYDWKMVSLVLGAYVAKDLGPKLRLALDAGVALSGALQSDRKQDFNFGSPERWNASVCLEISTPLGGR